VGWEAVEQVDAVDNKFEQHHKHHAKRKIMKGWGKTALKSFCRTTTQILKI
jgi:hypothetical protein